MSDFDREAEREKLREKYERDKKKREATEKMSELLLQGATMTNAHCSECGDPIFRYDGQEFCATCQKPVERGTKGGDGDGEEGDSEDRGGDAIEVTEPSDDVRVAFGADGVDDAKRDRDRDEREREESDAQTGEDDGGARPEEDDGVSATETDRQHTSRRSKRKGESARGADRRETSAVEPDEGIAEARNSLIRTLIRFSELAEASDDPQRAREYLATAREAAEALAALRR